MTDPLKSLRTLAPFLLLAGCATAGSEQAPAPAAAAPAINTAGLGSVMGQTAAALVQAFGTPDLDVREGTARKLQFSSQICVLDAYLYPRAAGREAVVTHVDARLPDGRDVDRASCVAALRAKSQSR